MLEIVNNLTVHEQLVAYVRCACPCVFGNDVAIETETETRALSVSRARTSGSLSDASVADRVRSFTAWRRMMSFRVE